MATLFVCNMRIDVLCDLLDAGIPNLKGSERREAEEMLEELREL
ncbi:MAG: hypothetical protein ACTSPV_16660 [Candidatus Hodarchaeales archaeon]